MKLVKDEFSSTEMTVSIGKNNLKQPMLMFSDIQRLVDDVNNDSSL